MKSLPTSFTHVIALSIIVSLASCGGGGGGGGAASSTSISAAQIAINNTNAPSVGGAAVDASTASTNLSTAGATLIGGVSVDGGTTSTGLVEFAVWQLTELSKLSPQPANLIGAIAVSGSQSCSGGGSFSYNFDDTDSNRILSIGETLSIAFNNCIMPPGAPISGDLTLMLSSKTGTPGAGAWSADINFTFSNLTMSGETLSGDIAFKLSTSNSYNINATLTGSSLTLTKSTNKVATISGYNYAVTYNEITHAYTFNASGTLTRSDLGGAVSFGTPTTFVGNFNNSPDNPTSGRLLVAGSANSKLRITAIDKTYVELAVDADGDGTYETTSTKTWAEISAL